MNNETNLPQSELLNNSDLEAEIQAYLNIESELPPELRQSRDQIEQIIKQKQLAKTLTVALPMPECDGQSDNQIHSFCEQCAHHPDSLALVTPACNLTEDSCCRYFAESNLPVQPTDSYFDPLPLSAYSELERVGG